MTSATPTIKVSLDDGTGTFPTDITSTVSLSSLGVSGFGRSDEFSQAAAASLSLVLKNDDGRFSGHGLGFGGGGFGGGPFGGTVDIEPGTLVRLTETFGATVSNRFTGRVSEIGLGWNGGVAKSSQLNVTCVDLLADLSRRPMRSMLEEEFLLRSPSYYYTLGDAEGSTAAGDTSGNQAPVLTPAGSGAAVAFGGGIGPTDGLTAAIFSNGQYLRRNTGIFSAAPTTFAFGAVINTTTPAIDSLQDRIIQETSGWVLGVDNLGHIIVSGPIGAFSGSRTVIDGADHIVIVRADGANARLYVDGVADGSSAITSASDFGFIAVGGQDELSGSDDFSFVGTMSHVAAWPSLTLADVTAISQVALSVTEATDARLSRLASYVGMTATTASPSGQIMGAQATSGSSIFDAMQAVATAEGGVLYADGSGVLRMQGRYYRGLKTTPSLTIATKDIDAGVGVTWDTQQKINQISVSRTGGASQVVQSAAVTADRNEPIYPASLDLAVDTDENALGAAQWELAKHGTTEPRLASLTLKLLTSSAAASLLALSLGDRVALGTMPAQMYVAEDYTVEGWSETLTVTDSSAEWAMTVNLLPWGLAEVFILDNATYGVLDSAVPIGY